MDTVETDLITTAEAAAILGITVKSLNRWAEAGRITEAVKAPGLRGPRFFHRADVTALAASLAPGQEATA